MWADVAFLKVIEFVSFCHGMRWLAGWSGPLRRAYESGLTSGEAFLSSASVDDP
jgi:hypothetical protein